MPTFGGVGGLQPPGPKAYLSGSAFFALPVSPMLGIETAPFPPGLHQLTLTPSAEEVNLDPAMFEDITVEVRLDHEQDRDLIAFTARATATLECDRTLVPFQQAVRGDYAVLFVLPEHLERYTSDEGGGEDIRPLPEPGAELDITGPVRDTLLLALPARRVAPGAEDENLPVQFGALTDAEGNVVDPRWEALKKLRDSQ